MISIVITLLIAVIGYQGYWLLNQYHLQKQEFGQQVMDAIEVADFGEMSDRADRLRHHLSSSFSFTIGSEENSDELVSSAMAIKKGKEYDVITRKIVFKRYHKPAPKEMPNLLGVVDSLNPYQETALNLRNQLHSVLDTMGSCNLALLHQQLKKRLFRNGNDSLPVKVELMRQGRVVGECHSADFLRGMDGEVYVFRFTDDQKKAYRVTVAGVDGLIMKNMAGILVGSLMIFLLLAFVFWYLVRTVRNLRTLDEMKSDFTNNITHELKTPIAVAYAANDAMLNFDMANDAEKSRKYLTISQQQLKRLSGLVEQILSMSMERRKTMKLEIEEVSLRAVVEPLIAQHQLKTRKKLDMAMDIPEGLTVRADRGHLSTMISNLIDNAIKYSTDEAVVRIRATKVDNQVVIAVSDQGIGIAADKQKYIFDKFYRVPHGNLHEVKGYGLGLYYVKSMMDKFHGRVEVKSELNKGTTFKLIFNE